MKYVRLGVELVGAMLLSLGVLYLVLNLLSIDKKEVKKTMAVKKEQASHTKMNYAEELLRCLESKPIEEHSECNENKRLDEKKVQPQKEDIEIKESKDTRTFIMFIYVMVLLTMSLQIVLFSESFVSEKNRFSFIEKRIYGISEYNINTPPMLGIMGTLFSFGVMAAGASSSVEVMSLFRENVFSAVETTLYGGIAYILNSMLHIYIVSKRENDED